MASMKLKPLHTVHTNKILLISGLLFASLMMLPYLILGTGSIITYHDQLDGELFSYLLTAKYLFTDIRIYPEIMNGLPSTGAVAPASLFVLFYVVFKPFTAFLCSQWCIYLIGFLGMFLLLNLLTNDKHPWVAFAVAIIFMLLPFYPVYGLCIPGQPLLFYAVLRLQELFTEDPRIWTKSKIGYYLLIILYGSASSLVLTGFAILLVLVIWSLVCFKKNTAPFVSLVILTLTYAITNLSLIKQVLFPSTSYVSHKTEMVLSPQNLKDSFLEVLTSGAAYTQSYHIVILGFVLLLALVTLARFLYLKKTTDQGSFHSGHKPLEKSTVNTSANQFAAKSLNNSTEDAPTKIYVFSELSEGKQLQKFKPIFWLLLTVLLVSLYYALYHGTAITALRNASNSGLLKTFNLDRIVWLMPVIWCLLAAFSIDYFLDDIPRLPEWFKKTAVIALLGCWSVVVLLHSGLRPNLSKIYRETIKGDTYYALDWDRFFATDIYEQIDQAIGKPQDSYHVLSVGIYPAAAAYNGFYCLDGYSNNYPLTYKHTFRELMEGELAKSDYVRDFYDNWGNRCYITTAEQANYYTFEKKWNSVIYNLDLNIPKLQQLDCQYIFSAAYIMNAQDLGLTLLQEAPFETQDSWYHIYVYQIPPMGSDPI